MDWWMEAYQVTPEDGSGDDAWHATFDWAGDAPPALPYETIGTANGWPVVRVHGTWREVTALVADHADEPSIAGRTVAQAEGHEGGLR